MPEFIDQPIQVHTEGEPAQPAAFTWNGRHYDVVEIFHQWFDWGFGAGTPRRTWRTRRHRTYYRLRSTDGAIYELYADRGSGSRSPNWYLYQKLDDETTRG